MQSNFFFGVITTAVLSIFSTVTALAQTYTGGGFTVSIQGSGRSASYTGCDAKERCIHIPKASNYRQGRYAWQRRNFTYKMIPARNKGQYRLKVFDPNNKLLLRQTMTPIEQTKPNYLKDLVDFTECSAITTRQANSNVNIRQGPGLRYDVALQLKRGDGVQALARQGNWVKIVALVDGFPYEKQTVIPFTGWVHNRYINGCYDETLDIWRR